MDSLPPFGVLKIDDIEEGWLGDGVALGINISSLLKIWVVSIYSRNLNILEAFSQILFRPAEASNLFRASSSILLNFWNCGL